MYIFFYETINFLNDVHLGVMKCLIANVSTLALDCRGTRKKLQCLYLLAP